jgi:hypothetical protein
MNKKNNPFAEASDEPKPAPKKRGRPKKADKEVVSTSEENPIDDMLSKLTLNESDSQETVLNEDAFPSPVSEPEAKKQVRDEKMMDLFGDSEETLNELLEVKTEDDTEKAKELEKAARKAEEKAAKAKAKELEKAEKAARKAEEKAAKAKAKELEKAEKAAKKAEEKAEKAKAKELEKAEKTEQDKKVSDQLDEIGKLLAKPVVKMEIDVDKEFQEIQCDDDELDDLEAALSDLEEEQEEEEEEEKEREELSEDDVSDDEDVDLPQTRTESLD